MAFLCVNNVHVLGCVALGIWDHRLFADLLQLQSHILLHCNLQAYGGDDVSCKVREPGFDLMLVAVKPLEGKIDAQIAISVRFVEALLWLGLHWGLSLELAWTAKNIKNRILISLDLR